MVECSFHPVINRNSKQLMSKRTEVLREHQITAHEQLFQVPGPATPNKPLFTSLCPSPSRALSTLLLDSPRPLPLPSFYPLYPCATLVPHQPSDWLVGVPSQGRHPKAAPAGRVQQLVPRGGHIPTLHKPTRCLEANCSSGQQGICKAEPLQQRPDLSRWA